jgi:hypothetical protein
MMSEMVERVARAIHKTYHADTMDGLSGGSVDAAWDRLAEFDCQDEWRAAARAVIAAMREPTEAMIEGTNYPNTTWDSGDADVWRAMIDAALKG